MDQDIAFYYAALGVPPVIVIFIVFACIVVFNVVKHERNIGSHRETTTVAAASVANWSLAHSTEAAECSTEMHSTHKGTTEDQNSHEPVVVVGAAPEEGTADRVHATPSASTALPFERMSLVFRDLRYTVKLPSRSGGGTRVLLRGVSGYATPGRLVALMGASGSGKTTLLDVLARRKEARSVEGAILINGRVISDAEFNRIACYVEQQDVHAPLSTVQEALTFSAALRLPSTVTSSERTAFVIEVMRLLELADISHRLIGKPGAPDGLSPGERKRLTIGVELCSNAPIVFADEATTGLDSRAAAVVMRVLRAVAATGRTVICTVHQPSTDIFLLFDDMVLLQRGGYEAYLGPLGRRGRALVRYIEALPDAPRWPRNMNPASWMLIALQAMDVAAEQQRTGNMPASAALGGAELQEALLKSSVWTAASAAMAAASVAPQSVTASECVVPTSRHAQSAFKQFLVVAHRQWQSYTRDVGLNFFRFIALIAINLLFGVVYYHVAATSNSLGGVQTLVAAIFMGATFVGMITVRKIVWRLLAIPSAACCKLPHALLHRRLTS